MSEVTYVFLVCVSALVLLLGFMVKNILNLKKTKLKSNEKKI